MNPLLKVLGQVLRYSASNLPAPLVKGFQCVCMHMRVCDTCTCAAVCTCMHICGDQRTPGVLLYLSPLSHGLSLNLELCWQPGSPSDPSVSTPATGLELQMHVTRSRGFELRSSCLCSKLSYPLSHLPRAAIFPTAWSGQGSLGLKDSNRV